MVTITGVNVYFYKRGKENLGCGRCQNIVESESALYRGTFWYIIRSSKTKGKPK